MIGMARNCPPPANISANSRGTTEAHRPVAHYIRDCGLSTGLTVPLHLPDGGFATLTAIIDGTPADAEHHTRQNLGEMLVLAHALQAQVTDLLAPAERDCTYIRLTRRERECLQHSAKGLTAKGIAATLHRSEATVNLHLIAGLDTLGQLHFFLCGNQVYSTNFLQILIQRSGFPVRYLFGDF